MHPNPHFQQTYAFTVVMQFTNEVNGDETDFIVFGVMLVIACGTYEFAAMTGNTAYRAAVGVTIVRHSSSYGSTSRSASSGLAEYLKSVSAGEHRTSHMC